MVAARRSIKLNRLRISRPVKWYPIFPMRIVLSPLALPVVWLNIYHILGMVILLMKALFPCFLRLQDVL